MIIFMCYYVQLVFITFRERDMFKRLIKKHKTNDEENWDRLSLLGFGTLTTWQLFTDVVVACEIKKTIAEILQNSLASWTPVEDRPWLNAK